MISIGTNETINIIINIIFYGAIGIVIIDHIKGYIFKRKYEKKRNAQSRQ